MAKDGAPRVWCNVGALDAVMFLAFLLQTRDGASAMQQRPVAKELATACKGGWAGTYSVYVKTLP